MGDVQEFAATRIAGRDDEQRLLLEKIDGAVAGEPCAVFVHGEAGIGKTSLVRQATDDAAGRGVTVLWGRCLRFAAVESTYLPLVLALEGWLQDAAPDRRDAVLAGLEGASMLLPSLGGSGPAAPVRLLPVVDALISRIVALGPTVLVVDDVQWAGPASWDALSYLIAGFRHQRLAVVTTHRDEELAAGDPLLSWLADMRRLPSVSELPLARLGADETEDQLGTLVGAPVPPRLLRDVLERSSGNPYLTEMLVAGLPPGTERLPDGLPDALGQALLAAWHRMSPSARKVAQVLAVAGRPAGVADLVEVGSTLQLTAAVVEDAVGEAVAHGIVVPNHTGVWFRHPLIAESLLTTLLPGQSVPWHAAWAATLERVEATGDEELRRLAALALHHEAADDPAAALGLSLRAADLAHDLRSPRAEARHLARAVRLWQCNSLRASRDPAYVDLLERAARAAALVGEGELAADLWQQALDLVDPGTDPLRASTLIIDLSNELWGLGRIVEQPLEEARRCVELTSRHPDSRERAQALANLAFCSSWSGDEETAVQAAQQAVDAAHRSGSNAALAAAYCARAFAVKDADSCDRDTSSAMRYSELTEDMSVRGDAYVTRSNFLWDRGRIADEAAVARRAFDEALAMGGPASAFFAGDLARMLLEMGRVREAERIVRDGLAAGGRGLGAVLVRLAATQCAVRRGRLLEAGLHLTRARELFPALDERPGLWAPPLLAETLLAQDRPEEALALLSRTMTVQAIDPRVCDMMLMWGARAAADQADTARDRRDRPGVARARQALDCLVELRTSLPGTPFATKVPDDLGLPAMCAVYEAETRRCAGDQPPADEWGALAQACARADLVWEEHLALARQASRLCELGAPRAVAAVPMRRVHGFACREGAETLRQQVEDLARLGRIPLAETAVPLQRATPTGPFRSLTAREREILGHLVRGLTYAEIAGALFISEKTVSSHVSNLLRKTGTSSRAEVSALALRVEHAR